MEEHPTVTKKFPKLDKGLLEEVNTLKSELQETLEKLQRGEFNVRVKLKDDFVYAKADDLEQAKVKVLLVDALGRIETRHQKLMENKSISTDEFRLFLGRLAMLATNYLEGEALKEYERKFYEMVRMIKVG